MIYWIGFLVGALISTFLLSRVLLWLMRSWDGGARRLILVHLFAFMIAAFLGGMGMADGGAFAGAQAAIIYGPPQAFWFLVDMARRGP